MCSFDMCLLHSLFFFFSNDTATTEIYTLSLHDALPISGAGKRALLPVGLFSAPEKHMYEHATRVHPLYFRFMYQKLDDVQIDLPLGWQVSSLPQPVTQDAKLIVYNSKADNKNGTLHLERHLTVELALLEQKYYPTLRNFYQLVKNADEQQIVLQPLGAASGN